MTNLKFEGKIIGINLYWISMLIILTYTILCALGGDLINWSYLSFEVIFPFYLSIAVGEWGKTRADNNIDLIMAQSKSLFSWVLQRYLYVFSTVSLFAIIGMFAIYLIRHEVGLFNLMLIYTSPAFFLSTLCVLISILSNNDHTATMVCGILWLFTMMAKSQIHISLVQYFYLFIRFAGVTSSQWLINKIVLILLSFLMWAAIYWLYRKRNILRF